MAREQKNDLMRNVAVIVVCVTTIAFVFQLAVAGDLFPTSAPAATMHTIEEVSDALVGEYDSQDVVAKKEHSVLNWAKCVVGRVKGYDSCQFNFDKSPTPICYSGIVVAVSPPGLGTASFQWDHIAIDTKAVATSEFQLDLGGLLTSGTYSDFTRDIDCNDLGTNVIDAYTCNGGACDFCSTLLYVQDNTTVSTCAGAPPAGTYPDLVGFSALTVEMQIDDRATVSWDDVMEYEAGPIDSYSHEINGGGSIPGKLAVFDCADEAVSPVTVEWTGCNGSSCNSIFMQVYLQNSNLYCP